jgi:hypothetical protein
MAELASPRDSVTSKSKNTQQRDLFTGEWTAERPKRGDGSHIRLKPVDGEKPFVLGMASYLGEGPPNTFCQGCENYGLIAVQLALDKPEKSCSGCSIYARCTGHAAAMPRRDIRFCPSCKHFVAADKPERNFIIDRTGVVHRVDKLPGDVRGWRPEGDPQDKPSNT